jgi:hypothetical protein
MYVKVKLEVWAGTVVFQVLDMDEFYRAKDGKGTRVLYESKTLGRIVSCARPNLELVRICQNSKYMPGIDLRGSARSLDFFVATYSFESSEAASNLKSRVLDLLEAWTKSEDEKRGTTKKDMTANVYEF